MESVPSPRLIFFYIINCIFRKRGGGGGGGRGYTALNWLTLNLPGSTPTTYIDVMSMCSTLLYSVDMQTVTVQKHTPLQQT